MRNVTSLLLVSTVLFLSQPVHAEVSPVVGAGALQCGEFLAHLEDIGGEAKSGYTAWMQGYLTGKNIARGAAGLPFLDLTGPEGQFRYVKNYCEENPLKIVAFGVENLWQELLKQQILE